MATEDVIRSMRARMPWAVARRVFKWTGLDRSMGWSRTIARVAEGDQAYEGAEVELTDALEEHLLCGEKIVRMFELEPDDIADLKVRAAALHVPNSPFQEAYPILLGEAALGQQEPAGPTLTAVVKYEDGTAIVLASTRYLTTREIMDPADLPEAAAAELSEFSEVIGVRHQRLEAIDMLWIPDNGDYVELRADYPFGMQQRQGIVALERAAARLEGLLGRDFLVDQVNFFPVIQSLYDAAGDGAMVELGFMVSGSAQKLEKTRRDGQCCRVEAYHLGGVGVLDAPIQPYRTSVIWDVALGDDVISRPEISIRGTSLQTAEIDPVVGEMVVRNCAGFLDYEYVRDRIISHL